MNYEESLQYIHSVNPVFCHLGLERISALCRGLGDPQRGMRFIHVAGTNGKGSVSAMLEATLRAAGYRTGLFTSPYVLRFNERMRVNGSEITDGELAELTEQIRPVADAMEERPTEFELITAIAFAYFRRHACDVVILEVGLGGRLDSTNVIEKPALSVITGIDFDHTAILGNTIQEIAAEKAGIIKEGCPCLYGGGENAACRTIHAIADHRHAPYYTVDRSTLHVKEMDLSRTVFDFEEYTDLSLALLGAYQPYNASIVLTALRILSERGLPVGEDAIRKGLAEVCWPARFELLCAKDPIVIYDGGHNPDGVIAAVKSIREYFPEEQVNILSGVMMDKDFDGMVEDLRPVTRRAFTVTPENPRSLGAEEYAVCFNSRKIPAQAYATVQEAVCAAVQDSRESGVPLVCLGSLYLYRDLVPALAAALRS